MRAQTHPGLPFWHTVLGRLAQLFCDDGGGGVQGRSFRRCQNSTTQFGGLGRTQKRSEILHKAPACLFYLQKVCKHDFGFLRIRHQGHPGQKPKPNTTRATVVLRQVVSCRIKGTAAAPDCIISSDPRLPSKTPDRPALLRLNRR